MIGWPLKMPKNVQDINPRPVEVWQVSRPVGGEGAKGPPRISGTNSRIGKIQTAFERAHRDAQDKISMTLIFDL